MDDVQIATVRKNGHEHFRIAIREFHGARMVDLRIYALDSRGNPVPTPKGVAIKPELLDELIAGLQDACSLARTLRTVLPSPEPVPRHWQDGE